MSIVSLLLGWTGLPQWATELIVVAIACLGVGGGAVAWNMHEQHIGKLKIDAQIQAQVDRQEVHDAQVAGRQAVIVQKETDDYANALAAPVLNPVRVPIAASPPKLPKASGAGPGSDAPTANRGADHSGPVPPQSFGPELQAIGKDADAQISGLQDYISKVCTPK